MLSFLLVGLVGFGNRHIRKAFLDHHISGQIIATSHDLTSKGSWRREITLFQGNLGLWVKYYNLARYIMDIQNGAQSQVMSSEDSVRRVMSESLGVLFFVPGLFVPDGIGILNFRQWKVLFHHQVVVKFRNFSWRIQYDGSWGFEFFAWFWILQLSCVLLFFWGLVSPY